MFKNYDIVAGDIKIDPIKLAKVKIPGACVISF